MSIGRRLLELLYPPRCPFCAKLLRPEEKGGLCETCARSLPWTRPEDTPHAVDFCDGCAAPLWYRGVVADGIGRYKFQGRRSYAEAFGALMAQCARRSWGDGPELVTWVPLSAKRRVQRGYDQAGLLAKYAARSLGLPAELLLEKVRDTGVQSRLHEESARRANVQGAYRLRPGGEERCANRSIILVDDVVTTGATLAECAACLKLAGARQVLALTLTRAK